jgi:hypothetical protein
LYKICGAGRAKLIKLLDTGWTSEITGFDFRQEQELIHGVYAGSENGIFFSLLENIWIDFN